MIFSVSADPIEKQKTDCVILPIFEGKLSKPATKIDKLNNNIIQKIIKNGDFIGKLNENIILYSSKPSLPGKIFLIGLGNEKKLEKSKFKETILKALSELTKLKISNASIDIDKWENWQIKQFILATNNSSYKFNDFRTKNKQKVSLKKLTLTISGSDKEQIKNIQNTIKTAKSIADGVTLTKNLANTPANVCTPEYLSLEAKNLSSKYEQITTEILEEKDLIKLKMNAMLAVGQGSINKPKLIILNYNGTKNNSKPIVLVGKGITFDTGGHSLKPAASMVGMKYDMCGAATVMGVIKFAAAKKLNLNIVGIIAAAENMPGATAYRPDDIITSMSGLTIEVLNTDAEGRLVLCDALTYAEKYEPELVIDIATLTGACVVALGNHNSAVYSNDQNLANDLCTAGKEILDKCWQMPLEDEYQKQLESNFADLANIGGPEAGSITAACFLSNFTTKYKWAHLDVAGTACNFTGKMKAATGRPVNMLAQFLLNIENR